jgi:transcriptional regulator with XRE-family HTH domain
MQEFATVLRAYRKEWGWSQGDLAVKWSYSFETISAWERRKRFPSGPEVPRIAKLLGMGPEELAAIVIASKGGPLRKGASTASHHEELAQPVPFADGRLLWSLHLGIQDDGLHCVISCPLAAGGSWEIALDPHMDFQDIQQVYRVVSEHVMVKGMKQGSMGEIGASNVVPLGLVS